MYSCVVDTGPLKIRYGFVISLWKMIVDYTKDCFLCFGVFSICLKYSLQGLVVEFAAGYSQQWWCCCLTDIEITIQFRHALMLYIAHLSNYLYIS